MSDYLFKEIHGLFTINHLLFLLIAFSIVFVLIKLTYKKDIDKLIRIVGGLVVILEMIKVLGNKYLIGEETVNILPFYYCSFLVYLMIPAIFAKGKFKDTVYTIMMLYGFIPSLVFLLYPITAVNYHPIISFPFLHSLFYHSMMLYCSLIIMIKKLHTLEIKDIIPYSIATVGYCIIILIINKITNNNFMFSNYPSQDNPFLVFFGKAGSFGYSAIIILGQTMGSFGVTYYLYKFIQSKIK